MQVSVYTQFLKLGFLILLFLVNVCDANVIRKLVTDKIKVDTQQHSPNDSKNRDAVLNRLSTKDVDRVRLTKKDGRLDKLKGPVLDLAPPDHNDGVRIMRGGQLNKDFKREVFLGPDHEHFEELSEKDGKRKLMEIFRMADTSKDNYLDMEELTEWISQQTQKHFEEALEGSKKIFPFVDTDHDGKIHWAEYRKQYLKQRGYNDKTLDEDLKKGKTVLTNHDEEDLAIYRERWGRADEDDDDILNQEEFLAFLHPEQCKTMLNLLVDELLHDFDTDGDDKLTLAEFVSLPHLKPAEVDKAGKNDEWVRERITEFRDNMDLNHDGVCDKTELEAYFDPRNRQHAQGEASHLIGVADENEDNKLSAREVIINYYVFIGSKLYNYGKNVHDEF